MLLRLRRLSFSAATCGEDDDAAGAIHSASVRFGAMERRTIVRVGATQHSCLPAPPQTPYRTIPPPSSTTLAYHYRH